MRTFCNTARKYDGLRRRVSGIFIRFHEVNFDNLGNCPSKPLKNDKKDIRRLQRFKKRINSKMTSYSHLRDISLGNLKIWIDVSFCSRYLIKCRLFMITGCFSSLKTVAPSRRKFFCLIFNLLLPSFAKQVQNKFFCT